jgi:hypothetical protein
MSAPLSREQLLNENKRLTAELRELRELAGRVLDFLLVLLANEPQRLGARRANARRSERKVERYLKIRWVALSKPRRARESVTQFHRRIASLTNVDAKTVARALAADPRSFPISPTR